MQQEKMMRHESQCLSFTDSNENSSSSSTQPHPSTINKTISLYPKGDESSQNGTRDAGKAPSHHSMDL